jgi:hypothetical protein
MVNHTVVGGRAALEVDGAVRHQRDAVGRGHELVVGFQVRHLQLGLHRVDDLRAQVHGVADGPLLVVVVGERQRGVAVADGDRARILDFLQGAFLSEGRKGNCERRQRGDDGEAGFHGHSCEMDIDLSYNAEF